MSRSERQARSTQVDQIIRGDIDDVLWVQAVILAHRRRVRPGSPCPCCGSVLAEIAQTIQDVETLIDPVSGERVNRAADPEWFDREKRENTVHVPVYLRCSEKQLPLLTDGDHKVIAALGGNRSGKSTVGVYWIARQWILKGGRGAQFWLLSYQLEQTHVMMEKLILGEFSSGYQSPPALPLIDGKPLLARKWPESLQSADQTIYMIDGSRFRMHHARYKGGNLKGKSVQGILGDEYTEIRHKENHTIALARLTESRGSLFISTTPMGGHWLKEELVDRVDANAAPDLTYTTLSQLDNPWVPEDEVQRLIRSIGDEVTVRREVHGEWIGNKGELWKHFDADVHVVDGDSYRVEDYLPGAKNVTKVATLKFWRGPNPYTRVRMTHDSRHVAGQDFNTDFMNMVVGQVYEAPNGVRGLFISDEVVLRQATTPKFAQWLAEGRGRRTRMPSYPGLPIACDPSGGYYAVHQVRSDKNSTTDAKEMARGGFDCRPCHTQRSPRTGKITPIHPPLHSSVSLVQKLFRENRLIIHSRCADTIKALLTQEDDGRGRPVKISNTASDRLAGPTDALRYLVWPLFSTEYETRGKGFRDSESSPLAA